MSTNLSFNLMRTITATIIMHVSRKEARDSIKGITKPTSKPSPPEIWQAQSISR